MFQCWRQWFCCSSVLHCAPGQATFPQDGFAVRQAIAQQFASAADFEERVTGKILLGRFELTWLFPLQQQMKCDLLFSKSHIVFVVAKITRFTTNPQDEELNEPEGGSMRLTSSELLKNIIQQYDARLNTKNNTFDVVRKMLLSRHKGQRNIEAIQHNATKRMYAQPTKLLSDDTPTKPDFEATAASEAFLNPLKLMVTPRRSGRLFGFLIGKRWKICSVWQVWNDPRLALIS